MIKYDFKGFALFIVLKTIKHLGILLGFLFIFLFIGCICVTVLHFPVTNDGEIFHNSFAISLFGGIIFSYIIVQHTYIKNLFLTLFLVMIFFAIFSNIFIETIPKYNSSTDMDCDWIIQQLINPLWIGSTIIIATNFINFYFKAYKFKNIYNLVNLTINSCSDEKYLKGEELDFLIIPYELIPDDRKIPFAHYVLLPIKYKFELVAPIFKTFNKNLAKYFIDEKESEK